MGCGTRARTHTRHTVHSPTSTRTHKHRLRIHIHSAAITHAHAHQKTPDSETHPENATTQQTSAEPHAHTHTHSRTHLAVPAGREAAQSCGLHRGSVLGGPGVPRASCAPREGAPSPGSEPGPARAPTSQPSPGTAPARPPGAQPRPGHRRSARRPGPPLSARRPLAGPPLARAPRSPGAASDQQPASAARNLRNNKQSDMPEAAAAGPGPPLSLGPCPTRAAQGAPPRQLVPAQRATHAHTHTRAHTSCHRPLGRPRPRAHSQPRPRRAPHSQHSWTRSQHTRTHSHTLTSAPDSLPHTHSRHTWHSLGPTRPPAAHTTYPRHSPHVHSARTHTFRTRSHAFTHVHGSQKHTRHTRVPGSTLRRDPESNPSHRHNTNTQTYSQTQNKQHSQPLHAKYKQMQHISRYNSRNTTKLRYTHNSLGHTNTTHWQTHKTLSAHPMPRCHTTFTPNILADTHHLFLRTELTDTQHSQSRNTPGTQSPILRSDTHREHACNARSLNTHTFF